MKKAFGPFFSCIKMILIVTEITYWLQEVKL